jgi:phosphoglycerol transferase MdoB-like AlkP superfamily enzyme
MLLQRFFEQVKEKNLFTPDTLFIVTSDHTPNPNYGHLELPGIKNFEQLGKIPLVFVSANPKPLQNIERNKIASQVDLPVTLCSLLGIEAPWYYQGRDLTCSATLPLSIGHLNEHFYIKTASRSYIIPQQIGNKSLNAEEEAIHKFFAVQNTVEFNRQDF